MTYPGWDHIQTQFRVLGGEILNLQPRVGSRGRGLFALDSSLPSGIFCPKHLFLHTEHIHFLASGALTIEGASHLSHGAASFLSYYYNSWAWLSGGRSEALIFLEGISLLPIQYRAKLIELRLLPSSLLVPSLDELSLFKRFIYTRTAYYESFQVLAPVWDLVNHSAFAQPFRTTSLGIHTPPRGMECEHLHKYLDFKSPLGMWAHYGFSCASTVAFSCPAFLTSAQSPITLQCLGEHYSKSSDSGPNVIADGSILRIRSLPIGSISAPFPLARLRRLLQPFGLPESVVLDFFHQLWEWNVAVREELRSEITDVSSPCIHSLQRGLSLELELIAHSRIS